MFNSNKNYTQIPNQLLEVLMGQEFNNSEKSILLCIARKTFGFHKTSDKISLSQIQESTGLSRRGVVKALKGLKDKDVISVRIGGGLGNIPNSYSIKVGNCSTPPSDKGRELEYTKVGNCSIHTKETYKETNDNEIGLNSLSKQKEMNKNKNPHVNESINVEKINLDFSDLEDLSTHHAEEFKRRIKKSVLVEDIKSLANQLFYAYSVGNDMPDVENPAGLLMSALQRCVDDDGFCDLDLVNNSHLGGE